jgi:hypothetical protein
MDELSVLDLSRITCARKSRGDKCKIISVLAFISAAQNVKASELAADGIIGVHEMTSICISFSISIRASVPPPTTFLLVTKNLVKS